MPDPQPFTDDDRDELVAYLDGELPPDAQRRVESRLNSDPTARTEADTLRRAWDLLDYLPRAEPSPEFTERTLDRISALQSPSSPTASRSGGTHVAVPWYRRRAAVVSGWAAAACLAVATGYALGPGPSPPEPDPDTDPLMVERPRVVEYLPLYLAAENLDYLLALDQSDLFADDGTGR
jgi:anti-sigma-K factor RskA